MKKINLDKHFLKKDHMHVALELKCIGDCLEQTIQHFKQSDFDKAKECTIDMLSSLQTITNLAEDKQVHGSHHGHSDDIPTFTEFLVTRMTRP